MKLDEPYISCHYKKQLIIKVKIFTFNDSYMTTDIRIKRKVSTNYHLEDLTDFRPCIHFLSSTLKIFRRSTNNNSYHKISEFFRTSNFQLILWLYSVNFD